MWLGISSLAAKVPIRKPMKLYDLFWDSPDLDPFRKRAKAKQILFEQGFPAQSFFILTQGMIELITKKNNSPVPVHFLGAGNMLGEHILVQDHLASRIFGARALGDITYLEFSKEQVRELRKEKPVLFSQIVEAALKISSERLNRMNRLLLNMRSLNPTERFLNLLLYFSAHHGQVNPEGKQVVLQFETVNFYIQINSAQYEALIEDLIQHRIIKRVSETVYLLKNEKALQDKVPQLSKEIGILSFV